MKLWAPTLARPRDLIRPEGPMDGADSRRPHASVGRKSRATKIEIRKTFQCRSADFAWSSPVAKDFTSVFQKKVYTLRHPASMKRGASRSSRHVRRDCGGRFGDARDHSCGRTAFWRTAKSCGPDTPTLVSSTQRDERCGRWEQESPVPRESTKDTVKPSRRECRLFRLNLWCLPPAFSFAGGPWVRPASGIPCALFNFGG